MQLKPDFGKKFSGGKFGEVLGLFSKTTYDFALEVREILENIQRVYRFYGQFWSEGSNQLYQSTRC